MVVEEGAVEVGGEGVPEEGGVAGAVPIIVEEGGEGVGEKSVLSHFVCRSHCNKWFCI